MIVKILAHAPFLRTKVAPIYHRLDFLTLNNLFKLEVLKFVFNLRKKKLPKCFDQYFQPVVHVHNYPTRFAENSLAFVRFSKLSTQRSIRYTGSRFWNDMPEKIKSSLWISYTTFVLRLKEFLKGDQYQLVFFLFFFTVCSQLFCFYLMFKVCFFFVFVV